MKLKHNFSSLSAEKEVSPGDFILTNRLGSFYYSALETRYGGWFIFDGGEMFKILEAFPGNFDLIENNFFEVNRKGRVLEEFYFPLAENSLVYGSSAAIDLILDVRRPFDNRVWGREYSISVEDGRIVIEFAKKTDKREDKTSDKEEFKMFLAVSGEGEKVSGWIEKKYALDEKRKAFPAKRHVYHAVRLKPGKYVLTASRDKENVLAKNKQISKQWKFLREKQEGYYQTFDDENIIKLAVRTALDKLVNHFNGKSVWAGLPWFFQEWNRDEAVSCKALMLEGEFELVKNLLMKHLNFILDDGRLPNYHQKSKTEYLESADGVGWVFLRLGELIDFGKLDDKNLKLVKSKLMDVIEKLMTYQTKDKLAVNGKLETWMDTIDRSGACIEIQALRLRIYSLAFKLTKDRKYKVLENDLREKVRSEFWDEEMLVDRLGDLSSRPNVFLACYIYPELLTKEEWSQVFEYILERNWLEWGGLSTVGVKDPKFVGEYSGEDNKSYHNGDSWFWINNIAAMAMFRMNKEKFRDYIDKILEASKQELLWSGCLGGCAELSSAKELRSEGCVLQAWSCATLIELMEELKTQSNQ